ncbi:hypothetical protein AGMMS50233_04040 [Endomicrobiia bacterium]|nr:hypothetical protein AGMMS50233_04040 [Endomicrobiia bacterium]
MKDLTRRQKETRNIDKNNDEITQEGKVNTKDVNKNNDDITQEGKVKRKVIGAEMRSGIAAIEVIVKKFIKGEVKMRNTVTTALKEIRKGIEIETTKITQEAKSKMENIVTIVLKKLVGAEMKKVMTAIIVFGMIISPAVNAMAMNDPKSPDGDVPPPPPFKLSELSEKDQDAFNKIPSDTPPPLNITPAPAESAPPAQASQQQSDTHQASSSSSSSSPSTDGAGEAEVGTAADAQATAPATQEAPIGAGEANALAAAPAPQTAPEDKNGGTEVVDVQLAPSLVAGPTSAAVNPKAESAAEGRTEPAAEGRPVGAGKTNVPAADENEDQEEQQGQEGGEAPSSLSSITLHSSDEVRGRMILPDCLLNHVPVACNRPLA